MDRKFDSEESGFPDQTVLVRTVIEREAMELVYKGWVVQSNNEGHHYPMVKLCER